VFDAPDHEAKVLAIPLWKTQDKQSREGLAPGSAEREGIVGRRIRKDSTHQVLAPAVSSVGPLLQKAGNAVNLEQGLDLLSVLAMKRDHPQTLYIRVRHRILH